MTLKRNDGCNTFTDKPRRLEIRFRDRVLAVGEPYPVNSLEVDQARIGQLTLTITTPMAEPFDRGYGPKVGPLTLTNSIYELDIDEPFPANEHPLQTTLRNNGDRIAADATIAQQATMLAALHDLASELDELLCEGGCPMPKSKPTVEILTNLVEHVRSARTGHDTRSKCHDLKGALHMLHFAQMFALGNWAFVGTREDVKKAQSRFQEVKQFLTEREALFREMRTELGDMHANCSGLPVAEITAEVVRRYPDLELPK